MCPAGLRGQNQLVGHSGHMSSSTRRFIVVSDSPQQLWRVGHHTEPPVPPGASQTLCAVKVITAALGQTALTFIK